MRYVAPATRRKIDTCNVGQSRRGDVTEDAAGGGCDGYLIPEVEQFLVTPDCGQVTQSGVEKLPT